MVRSIPRRRSLRNVRRDDLSEQIISSIFWAASSFPAYACIRRSARRSRTSSIKRKIDFVKARRSGLTKPGRRHLLAHRHFAGWFQPRTAAYAQVGYQTAYLKRHYTPGSARQRDRRCNSAIFCRAYRRRTGRCSAAGREPGRPDFLFEGRSSSAHRDQYLAAGPKRLSARRRPFRDLKAFAERIWCTVPKRRAKNDRCTRSAFGRRSALDALLFFSAPR